MEEMDIIGVEGTKSSAALEDVVVGNEGRNVCADVAWRLSFCGRLTSDSLARLPAQSCLPPR